MDKFIKVFNGYGYVVLNTKYIMEVCKVDNDTHIKLDYHSGESGFPSDVVVNESVEDIFEKIIKA